MQIYRIIFIFWHFAHLFFYDRYMLQLIERLKTKERRDFISIIVTFLLTLHDYAQQCT